MRTWKAVQAACTVYGRNFADLMRGMVLQTVIRLMVAAPLLFLTIQETRPLALLSIVGFVLLILPLRQNSAAAMQDVLGGGRFTSWQLISTKDYGAKLLRGLRQAGWLALWGLPFIAATVLVWLGIFGKMDAFTLVRTVMMLGGGSFITGMMMVAAIYGASLLLLLAGSAFHSGARHGAALHRGKDAVRGHRWALMGVQLLGVLVFVPFAAVAAITASDYVTALAGSISSVFMGGSSVTLPPLDQRAWIIGAAFVVLVLPLLPLKQLMTAAFVRDAASVSAEAKA